MDLRNEHISLIYDAKAFKNQKTHKKIAYMTLYTNSFFRTIQKHRKFVKNVRDTTCCLEIESGHIGVLALILWIKERIIIEPFLDLYIKTQLDFFGKTFFTNNIQIYSQNVEKFIPSLEDSINGFIVSRNALDYCEDLWKILKNISRYASKKFKLLLCKNLWYLKNLDGKHKNIIKNKKIFEKKNIDLGFRIENNFFNAYSDKSTIKYDYIVTKL
jgi:hypothetical protein